MLCGGLEAGVGVGVWVGLVADVEVGLAIGVEVRELALTSNWLSIFQNSQKSKIKQKYATIKNMQKIPETKWDFDIETQK